MQIRRVSNFGQQQRPFHGGTQFWFHDPVEVVSLMPFGDRIDTVSQLVTLSGENFLNVTTLTVQFGSNLYCDRSSQKC